MGLCEGFYSMNVTQKNQQALTKRFGQSVVVLFGVLSVCFVVNAQDFKLGVINTQKVVESYSKAIEADTELKTLQDRLAGRLRKLEDEIITMEERLTKQELFLDEDAVRSAQADIARKQDEYRQKLKVGQDSLMEK